MATSVVKSTVRKTSAPAGVKPKATKTTTPAAAPPSRALTWDTLDLVIADQIVTGFLDLYRYPNECEGRIADVIEEGYEYAARVIVARRKYLADHVTLK
jgi:hypothetical protein